jgi:CheY-like chemotaxis protein
MKLLSYKIGWIDNQPNDMAPHQARLTTRLGRLGFDIQIEWVSTADGLKGFIDGLKQHREYDLILVDWQLGQMVSANESGVSVAEEVRRHSLATLVFYSAATSKELRQQIAKKLVDGVFCVNREYFVHEAMQVIEASIRKYSDLNAMRGLFLAAVAEFDELIRGTTFKAYKDLDPERKQALKDKLIDGTINYLREQLTEAESVDRRSDLGNVVKKLQPSSWPLFESLLEVLKMGCPTSHHADAVEKFSKYGDEILTVRNDMAHVKEKVNDDGTRSIIRGDREWSSAKFSQLRQLLSDHYSNLEYIREPLLQELLSALSEQPADQAMNPV